MDAVYGSPLIKQHSQSSGHILLIDENERKAEIARMARVKGLAKVMAHLVFGITTLTANQLIKFAK